MKKSEIIKKLHENGEFWANEKYPKKELEDYLNRLEQARHMSDADLFARLLKGV